MTVPTIELTDLGKTFGQVHAVSGVNLRIDPGEIVALLGPNGAGKTTTIDMTLGLTRPTVGSVRVFGQTPRQAVVNGQVGAMMQTGGLLRDTSVKETVQMIAALQQVQHRVDEVLAATNLVSIAGRRVSKCSGGEQQRVKFALALIPDPQLLILDEPTSGMDVAARREFWATMRAQANTGKTIIFATHYLAEAQDFAQRIVLIAQGRVLADGPTDQIRAGASGRQVSATLNGDESAQRTAIGRYCELFHDAKVQRNGSRITFTTNESDDLARCLLADDATDLTITEPSLEDVFLTLTKDAR